MLFTKALIFDELLRWTSENFRRLTESKAPHIFLVRLGFHSNLKACGCVNNENFAILETPKTQYSRLPEFWELPYFIIEHILVDAVREASEYCDQAVVTYCAWSKRSWRQRNAPPEYVLDKIIATKRHVTY